MNDTKLLDRVRALLAKAEGTDNEHEADAFNAKAAELIAKYGIDEALAAHRKPERDLMGRKTIDVDNPYAFARMHLLTGIATALRCKPVYWWDHSRPGEHLKVAVIGFTSDLERTELLYTSLCLQATSGMLRQRTPYGQNATAYRRTWLMGFASAVGTRLQAAERKAADEADDTGTPGTALVLADRKTLVDQAFREAFPRTGKGGSTSYSGTGRSDGYAAGQRADLGGTGIASRRAALR